MGKIVEVATVSQDTSLCCRYVRTLGTLPVNSPIWDGGTSMDDLVVRDGLTYKKFTDVPFTGEIDEGLEQGDYKNGEKISD